MGDEFTLTLPRRRPFYGIVDLVLGGFAARLDLTLEDLEDLRLALEELLVRAQEGGDVTVIVRIEGRSVHTSIGPVAPARVRAELERGRGDQLTLARLLETVVDRFDVAERDGEAWIELRKDVS